MKLRALLFCILAMTFSVNAQEVTPNDAKQDQAVAIGQHNQNVAVAIDNAKQNKAIAKVTGKVDAISDRQFMLVMVGVIAVLLVAIWLMLQRGASRQHTASKKLQAVADILMERTEKAGDPSRSID